MTFITENFMALSLLLTGSGIVLFRLFHPNHRSVGALFLLFGVIASFRNYFQSANLELSLNNNFTLHLVFWVIAGLIAFNAIYILITTKPFSSKMPELSKTELNKAIQRDTQLVLKLKSKMDKEMEKIKFENYTQYSYSELLKRQSKIISIWRKLHNHLNEVERISEYYGAFYRMNLFTRWIEHRQAFIIFYATHLLLYKYSFSLTSNLSSNAWLVRILNSSDKDLPLNSFDRYSYRITGVVYLMRQILSHYYYQTVRTKKNPILSDLIETDLRAKMNLKLFVKYYLYNMMKFAEVIIAEALFPIQKAIGKCFEPMVLTKRKYHIKPSDLKPHKNKLKPGDIFLERREWEVSNFGIPGYWTHTAIYLGTLKEIDHYFKDKKVTGLKGMSFSNYIKKYYPKAFKKWSGKDTHDFEYRVIEAKGEGVIFTSLEFSAGADALAVLRSKKINPQTRFQIIIQALDNYNKPYDFDFNFATHHDVMCSELVYRSYLNTGLINFVLTDFGGRIYFTPNHLIEQFDQYCGTKNAELDFVLFLDGHEKTKEVAVLGEKQLRASWQRSMWQVAKELLMPEELSWDRP